MHALQGKFALTTVKLQQHADCHSCACVTIKLDTLISQACVRRKCAMCPNFPYTMSIVWLFDLQGPSPDEVALVEGGRQLGFEFLSRTMQGVTLRMLGHECTFDVLNMMEFSSERGRMSVIARSPDGTIRLFAKGADSKMLANLNKDTNPDLLEQTSRNLHLFATQVGYL